MKIRMKRIFYEAMGWDGTGKLNRHSLHVLMNGEKGYILHQISGISNAENADYAKTQ